MLPALFRVPVRLIVPPVRVRPGRFNPVVVNDPPRFSVPPLMAIPPGLLHEPSSVRVVPAGAASPALFT